MGEPSTVEIDFFQIEKQNASPKRPSLHRVGSSSGRRIQNVVSKINPLVLKTVMAAGTQASSAHGVSSRTAGYPSQCSSNSSSPSGAGDANRTALLAPLPVLSPASRSALHDHPERAPLTIFYNGTVTTLEVPRDKAEAIIRMAESGIMEEPVERPQDSLLNHHQMEGDLPIARRRSLQRFLDKRKERVTSELASCRDN